MLQLADLKLDGMSVCLSIYLLVQLSPITVPAWGRQGISQPWLHPNPVMYSQSDPEPAINVAFLSCK